MWISLAAQKEAHDEAASNIVHIKDAGTCPHSVETYCERNENLPSRRICCLLGLYSSSRV